MEGMAAKDDSELTEFDRFSDLAKRLVKVPKKELDAERERQQSAKRA